MAQGADGCGAEGEQPRRCRIEPEPSCGQDAKYVAVGEQRRISVHCGDPGQDTVGALRYVLDGLAVRYTIEPQAPVRPLGSDLGGGAAFVIAIVTLAEVGIDLGGG